MERVMKSASEWHCLARPKRERLSEKRKYMAMREGSLPQRLIMGLDTSRLTIYPILMELKLKQITRK